MTAGTRFEAEVQVRWRRFVSEDTGFAVLDCEDADGDEVVLVGPLAHLEARERAHVVGAWVHDRRYGPQVRVDTARPLAPAGDALIAYLRQVRHVGPARARALVEAHGDLVLDAIDRDPVLAFRAGGLGARQAAAAARSWDGLRAARTLHLLLAPEGLGFLVARIRREYGDEAHRVVRERPYELTSVFGVGFETADRIARSVGIARDSPERTRAAVVHVLADAERGGSTCLPLPEALARTGRLLGGRAPGAELVSEMVERGDLAVLDSWVYRAPTAALEEELAARVRALLQASPVLGRPRESTDQELTSEQWAGVRAAFAHRLSLITGGPGTGKTVSIRQICAAGAAQRVNVQLVAPTGRAAVRMAEATGANASTIHSALGWVPGHGPSHDEDDPLRCDLLIVDETSMANLALLVTLLRAVGPRTHVVLVGDADQLAPVGAGKPFAELVESGVVPTARLTHIFRQAAGSMIVQGAHAIRAGRPPSFAAGPDMRRDLFLLERPDPARALDEIVELVAERLPRHYGVDAVTDIQVFAPVYRGPLGIDALNVRLRDVLNPRGEPACDGRFRIGDKLMLTGRNLHDLGLMNGTILRLVEERVDDDVLVVSADGLALQLPLEESSRLTLAYACSVHKGQGIELPIALLVAHPAAGAFFLRREMLYTALTRARVATVVVGVGEVLARAARTPDVERRHSGLVGRLAIDPRAPGA